MPSFLVCRGPISRLGVLTVLTSSMLCLFTSGADAETIHYWRFEDSPGFTIDTVGALPLSASAGSPLQVALPGSGRGSTFDDAVASTVKAFDQGGPGVLEAPAFSTVDFTVEVLVHPDSLGAPFGHTIAGLADSQANTLVGWILQLRSNQPALLLCSGSTCDVLFSGLAVATGNDYFVAASVDLDGLSTTFYLKNLTTDTPLQTAVVAHTLTALNSPTWFAVGGAADSSGGFDGLIDELRISDHARTVDELLINETASVPALGFVGLVVSATLLLGVGAASTRR